MSEEAPQIDPTGLSPIPLPCIGFDSIAGEIFAQDVHAVALFEIQGHGIVIKHYTDLGTIVIELIGQELRLQALDIDDPQLELHMVRESGFAWRLLVRAPG